MTVIDTVSAASAVVTAAASGRPACSTPRIVSAKPKENATAMASTRVAVLPRPSAVPITTGEDFADGAAGAAVQGGLRGSRKSGLRRCIRFAAHEWAP